MELTRFVAVAVDISPITNSLIQLGAAALTALALWIGWYVKNLIASRAAFANTQIAEQLQQMYNEAALRSIAYAETVVKGAVPKTVDTDHQFVATAADYLVKFWPDLVGKLDLTPERVKETILARLPSGEMTAKADAIVEAKAAAPKPA
jgi:hypothetical protein